MKKRKLTKSDLKYFDNIDKFTSDYFILNLGVGLQYEYSPKGVAYSMPYIQMGKSLWYAFRFELYDLLCDSTKKEPNEWVKDLITGDIRNVATGMITAITAKYNVSIAIALPAVALIIKNGLLSYCSTLPKSGKQTVKEILEKKKASFISKNPIKTKKGTIKKKLRKRKNNCS